VAWVVDVLDDFFGLPVTLGAVGVLEFYVGHTAPPSGQPCGWVSAVAVPGGDTARQDAFNCASVNVCEGFRCQAKCI
jgi:hypothetical protein